MTTWNLNVPEETDHNLRQYLARIGAPASQISTFVDEAVRAELLRRVVHEIQDQNSDISAEDAAALADDAVAWTRANPS